MLYERLFLARNNSAKMGIHNKTKYACHWNPSCLTNGLYWVTYINTRMEVLIGVRDSCTMKLQASMKYSLWTLDTQSTLHTCSHIYWLKGIIAYWLNASKCLLSSKTGMSFFKVSTVNPVSLGYAWRCLEFISCLIQLPYWMECFSLKKKFKIKNF